MKISKALLTVFLALTALIGIAPLLFLISGAFMGNAEITALLEPYFKDGEGISSWHFIVLYPTLKNVIRLLLDSPEYFAMLSNSLKLAAAILAGQIIFGMPAAYILSVYDFKGRCFIYRLYIVLMLLPFCVTMLSKYLLLKGMGIYDTHLSVILPEMFNTLPVFIMYGFFGKIDKAIMEAARMDGASEIVIFIRIGIPLGLPGIMSAMVLGFIETFSMIEAPMTFLENKRLWPVSLYLPSVNEGNAAFCMCVSAAIVLVSLVVFFCSGKSLESGIESMGKGGSKV